MSRTAAATAAAKLKGQRRKAADLAAAGWMCFEPDQWRGLLDLTDGSAVLAAVRERAMRERAPLAVTDRPGA